MGYLEDYAFYAEGLLALYQTTFNPRWFQEARNLMDVVLKHFSDTENGGFYDTADDHEQLVTRPKSLQDNATPCGNSMAVRALLQLAAYTGQDRYENPAIDTLSALQGPMSQYPGAFTYWLGSLEFALAAPKEIAIIGQLENEDTKVLLETVFATYRPNQVVAAAPEDNINGHPELVAGRSMRDGKAAAYVCQKFTCKQPVTTAPELEALL